MNNYKGENMINLRKIGLTALAGSLAAVSAQAGEMSVTGSHITTYTTGDAGQLSAQSLGSNTNITFSGSGDLDNGWSVSTFVAMNDATTGLSSTAATMTMGDMGTIGVSKVGGFNVNGAYDETYPRAYEENSDAGGQSSLNNVGNWADDNAIIYKAPAIDLMGATVNIGIEHSLQAGTGTGGDGTGAARSDTYGAGTGVGVTILELVNQFKKSVGISVPYKFGKRRMGDVPELWANCDLAKKNLGWKAKYSLHDMILSSWN